MNTQEILGKGESNMLHRAHFCIGCPTDNMADFNVKTSFAMQQMEHGSRRGYDHLILALNKEDSTKGQYVSNMDLKAAIKFLQRKVNKYVCGIVVLSII